ncbi:Probable formyltetrahydrofolate deformylase [Mycobacterium tuberculosis]|nr:Probable formyltetrahydrofolate deformylase [Mycobacterium tuberculosis]
MSGKPIGEEDIDKEDIVLTFACPDRMGIVHGVSKFLLDHGCNIVESRQFDERVNGRFFMRVQFQAPGRAEDAIDGLRDDFRAVASAFSMDWRLTGVSHRPRVLILVSRIPHCLNDLLFRAHHDRLRLDIAGVVSNHPDLAPLADNYRVPFHHIPVTPESKPDAEARLLRLVEDLDVELVVLARYMQILSADLCKALDGRAINIHHSMLPSFKGAKPYHKAHERGVKLVGATAHYVTADLDEGPIIEQEIARVDHSMSADEITRLGKDNECRALARAVQYHAENRVLLDGQRTVVLV